MPLSPTNATAVFQGFVKYMLRDMLNYVFVYIDNILIFSRSLDDHVLRLLENSLFVKAEKCEFHAPSVSFLGYVISPGSIRMYSRLY